MHTLGCLVFMAVIYTIQGGSSPQVGKFPYHALIRHNATNHLCSGSIINKFNVLTSALCVCGWDDSRPLKIHVGTNSLNVSGDVYDVENVVVHENYSHSHTGIALGNLKTVYNDIDLGSFKPLFNDIALVHLKTPIKYNTLVQPINLMTSDKDIAFISCTLSGFGRATYGNITSNNLKEIELDVGLQEMCRKIYPIVTNAHMCTLREPERKFCKHYIGGPIVADKTQIGIASTSFCEKDNIYDVVTRVSSFIPWISTNLKNPLDEPPKKLRKYYNVTNVTEHGNPDITHDNDDDDVSGDDSSDDDDRDYDGSGDW
ncbi:PREDICTED: chymotrypsin-1-like [Vollenhovia emeryi]|uniref:chymotrypsin-1-like n=1 Tax=Vollenhovia emeryi TaxID=411798 RepID=UPI0005F40601|nr:PREDICTED: chymotrypsin-1-like [Vollenhovia emeryi]